MYIGIPKLESTKNVVFGTMQWSRYLKDRSRAFLRLLWYDTESLYSVSQIQVYVFVRFLFFFTAGLDHQSILLLQFLDQNDVISHSLSPFRTFLSLRIKNIARVQNCPELSFYSWSYSWSWSSSWVQSCGGLCVGHASWGCSLLRGSVTFSHSVQTSKVAAVPDGYPPVPDGYPPVPDGYPPVPDGYPYKG